MGLNVLGISAHCHDSACALLRDGELVAAAQEERFSRIKHDPGTPRHAFRYCLEQGGLTISDVDCVAYYEDPRKKLARHIWMRLVPGVSDASRAGLIRRLDVERPIRDLRKTLGFEGPIEIVDHHYAHAASSYYFSGFTDAAVFTVDGLGEWATTSYGRGSGHELSLFEEVQFPHSIGVLYSAIAAYLGFESNEGESRVMGLAPYGKPTLVDQIYRLIELGPDGQFQLRLEYFDFQTGDRLSSRNLPALFGEPARTPASELRPFHQNVARSLQVVLEQILLAKVRYLHQKVPSDNLCMAGDVAVNSVANRRILSDGPFKKLFVQPAFGDAGSALGAAAAAHVRRVGSWPRTERLARMYLGPSYSADYVHRQICASSAKFQDFRGKPRELISITAKRLASGQVIGWFQGRMEFGPSALGARSILADPRDKTMRERINALVRNREPLLPFTAVVLKTQAQRHFDLDHPSPSMPETCTVRSKIPMPAVTHVDGSARVLTADSETNPRLALLLEDFERRTGCPVLLMASFNMHEEPMACTPSDALIAFVRSGIDSLVIEDCILDKADVPPMWSVFVTTMNKPARQRDERGE